MKFKVGDKVRVKNGLIGGNYYDGTYFNEAMEKLCGKIFVIERVELKSFYFLNDGMGWCFNEAMLEPVEEEVPEKLVIYRNGNKTIAKYYKGDKTFEAEAKCSPEDEYDFKTGTELAMNRVMDKAKEEDEYSWVRCVGYRQKSEFNFTVGKKYKIFNNGKITHDYGYTYAGCHSKKAMLDFLSKWYIFEEI